VFPVRASVRGTLSRQAVISTAATVAALAVVIVAWSSGLQVMNATSGSGESILATERIASGADAVAAMAVAPDGRIFLAEQRTGRVRVIVAGLLVPDAVITFVLRASGPEDGLTGLAAAPDFASNNLLYAAYTYEDRNKSDQPLNRIVRFHVTPENRSSDLEVIRDDLPGGDFHNCNTLRFGPDGKLWFCNGDTGWTNDVSQSVASPEGKIHRINADGSIPVDNPFPHSSVYALGFRNPFGLGFEPNTGRLFVADNGPECCDEVDLVMPGGNYGWPYWKGDEVAEAGAPNERFIGPLWTRHVGGITRLLFVSANVVDALAPPRDLVLLVGTFGDASMYALSFDSSTKVRAVQHLVVGFPVVDLAFAPDGAVLLASYSGEVRRIVPSRPAR